MIQIQIFFIHDSIRDEYLIKLNSVCVRNLRIFSLA